MRKLLQFAFLFLLINSSRAAVSFSYTSPQCGLFGSFTNTSTGTNYAYLWNFGDPSSGPNNDTINFTLITQTHTFSNPGTYTVKLRIIDASFQATDSVTHTIVVYAKPNIMFLPTTIQTQYCVGDSPNVYITVPADPAYKYVWSPAPLTYSSPNSVEYRFSHTQTYTVDVTDTTTGCSSSKSLYVNFVNCTPVTSQFNFTPPGCGVYSVTFKNVSLASHHYRWYFGDPASGANDSLYKSDTSSVTHVYSDTGSYFVTLIAYDSAENKADTSVKKVILFKQTLAKIFNNDTTICIGSYVNLNGMGYGTGAWSPNINLSVSAGYKTTAWPQTTTKYYLNTNNGGCVGTDSVTITVLPKPDPGFNTDTLCIDEVFAFNASDNSNTYYRWDFGDGDTAIGNSVSHSYDTSGIFNVKLRVSNGLCDSIITKPVLVLSNPIAAFAPDKMKAEISKANFTFVNKSSASTSYSWDFGDLGTSNQVSPNHTYLDTGWYLVTLTALNSLGCEDTVSMLIRVDNAYKYFVPSAFSPNFGGPTENELFKPLGPLGTTKYEMVIYDRWGSEIFRTNDEKKGWDGNFSDGSECPIGTYLYSIVFLDPTSKRVIFRGALTLVR